MLRSKILLSILIQILLSLLPSIVFSETKLIFYTQVFPPFSYKENGDVKGPGADIIRSVCSEIGVTPEFEVFPWRRAIYNAKKGEANALFMLGWNRPRTEWLIYSPPIIKTEYGFFAHKDTPFDYRVSEDLKGLSVGVYGPSNTSYRLEKISEKIPSLEIQITPNDESAFKKANFGRTNAVYSNKTAGLTRIKKMKLDNLRYAGKDFELNYYIGFLKKFNDRELVDKFNSKLAELKKTGKIKLILEHYGLEMAEP